MGAYKFYLDEIDALVKAAKTDNKNPASVRVYYGCDANETNHQLYLAIIDVEDNVIQA